MDVEEFWRVAKRRRNLFFALWFGWPIAGFFLTGLYEILLPSDSAIDPVQAALASWGAIWLWSYWRVTQVQCFLCKGRAFSHPFFLRGGAKCRECQQSFQAPS